MLRHAHSPPSPHAFVQLLLAAQPPPHLFHAPATKLGFLASNVFVNTALLALYCRSRRLMEAQQLFDQMPHRSAVTWSTLIYGHARSPQPHAPGLAVGAFARMLRSGVPPTPSAVSSVLVACARLDTGPMLHSVALRCGLCANVVVGTALVDMYAKLHHLGAARKLLEEIQGKNVATFTALIAGFAADGRPRDAMLLVREMQLSGVAPNMMTYSSLLSTLHTSDHGRQVHCAVIKKGLAQNPFLLSALLAMYSRCDSFQDFSKVQEEARNSFQDQVSFNSLISGLSCLGRPKEAFQQFVAVRRRGAHTDAFTFTSVLKAVADSSSLLEGRQAHTLILKTGYAHDMNVQNVLISMYARCGAIVESKHVFASMEAPDLVSWNSLLSGCAQHGYGREVVHMFEQMTRLNVQPDHTTFLSVLTACSHVGFLDKGLEYINMMKANGFLEGARLEHYACMVDLLGRAGHISEAESLINDMPMKPSLSVYRALLGSCQLHGNLEIAIRASKRLIELYPHDSSAHVQLSKAFAGEGYWDAAAEIREAMTNKGIAKAPAWSCIEDQVQAN